MLSTLILVETVLLLVAVVATARRSRPAAAPYGRPLFAIAILLVAQTAAMAGFVAFVGSSGGPDRWGAGLHVAALAWLTQAARAGAVILALAAWVSIVRGSYFGWWRIALLAGAGVVLTFAGPPARLMGYAWIVIAIAGLPWPATVHGWPRVAGLLVSLPLALIATAVPITTVTAGAVDTSVSLGGAGGPPTLLSGSLPPAVDTSVGLARPFDGLIDLGLALFRCQLAVLFFKFLLLPVGLRRLSLKRRFAFNYTLTRSIPALLSTVLAAAVVYAGFSLHKAAQVRDHLEATLERAEEAVAVLGIGDDPGARIGEARNSLGPDAAAASLIVRTVRGSPGAAQSPDGTGAPVDVIASDGTPPALKEAAPFDTATSEPAAGIVALDGRLYLAARRPANSPEGRFLEAWVPLDEAYVSRLATRVFADVRISANPSVFLAPVGVRFTAGRRWIDSPIAVAAEARAGRFSKGFLGRKFPVGRLLLPAGNWRKPVEGGHGAVEAALSGTLGQTIAAFERNPYLFSSNAVPLLFIGGVAMLISLVEGLAVRTGRSIVSAVLDDIGRLRDGAGRIGSGDLDFRLPVDGNDELSSLAGSLNAMAADLRQQQHQLLEKQRLEADLEVARSIQQRLLPQNPPQVEGLDVAGISIPSRMVGGDLFYFLPFEGGKLGIAIGDVSGKSVPAALLMSNVLAVLRAEAQLRMSVDDSLTRINRLIAQQIEPNRFVTLFYGIVDRTEGVVRYARAGHNPPVRVSATGNVSWLRQGGAPLGVLDDETYAAASEPLEPGDVLVLYSDGLTESMGPEPPDGADPELFGDQRLAAAVLANRHRTAAEVVEALLLDVQRFAAGAPQSDDLTLVVLKIGS